MKMYRSNAFEWFLRNDPETIAAFLPDEKREEWLICYAALLALADD